VFGTAGNFRNRFELSDGGRRASCMREKGHPSASSDVVSPSAAEILREYPLHADVVRQFTLDGFD
jgi:hypothetical protein